MPPAAPVIKTIRDMFTPYLSLRGSIGERHFYLLFTGESSAPSQAPEVRVRFSRSLSYARDRSYKMQSHGYRVLRFPRLRFEIVPQLRDQDTRDEESLLFSMNRLLTVAKYPTHLRLRRRQRVRRAALPNNRQLRPACEDRCLRSMST